MEESKPVPERDETTEKVREAAEAVRDAAYRKVDEFKEVAREKGVQLRDAATEKTDSLKDFAEENLGISGEKIDEIKTDTETYVKENPFKSVAIALGLGFIIAKIFQKSRD